MVRINRVYTRTGDAGQTRLVGGQEVPKTAPRIEAYGAVDEANAAVGWARAELALLTPPLPEIDATLEAAQRRLFDLGAELACLPEDLSEAMPTLQDAAVTELEEGMDALNEALPALTSFILPGGGRVGAAFHLARTVTRRAERATLRLAEEAPVRGELLRYLNRLSDYLFVAGRAAIRHAGLEEPLWR